MIRRARSNLVAHEAIHRSDVDDATILRGNHSLLGNGTSHSERTEEVDLHLVVELLVGDVLSRGYSTRSSIVDEDVDAAKVLHGLANNIVAHLRIRDVATNRQHLHAILLAQLLRHLLEFFHTACDRHDVTSLICQCLGHLNTQSTRATRYDCHVAFHVEIVFHNSPCF